MTINKKPEYGKPNYGLELITAGIKEEIVEAKYKGRNKYMIVKTTRPAYMGNREFFETFYSFFPIKWVKIVNGVKLYRIV